MDSFLIDLRFALRSLRRRRTFALVAIVTIGLAVGAATSIFSVADGVLFRPPPYRDPGQLITVWQTIPAWRKEPVLAASWDRVVVSYPAFKAWRAGQTSFSAVGAWTGWSAILSNVGEREQVSITRVSPSLFDVLDVHPIRGRSFLPGEDVANGPHVAMVSYDAWRSRFGAREDILGKSVQLDSTSYQIIGVLPKKLELYRGQAATPFFIPAGQDKRNDDNPQNHSFRAIGRLRPGIAREQAATEADRLLGGPAEKRGIRLADYQFDDTRTVRTPLLLLLGAVGLLVIIACVNVATLLVGEAAPRETELGTRIALGAGRARLIRQLLTESLLLAAGGGALGMGVAWGMTKALVAIAPARIPGIAAAHVDGRAFVAAILITTITGVLFGLVPALTLSDAGPNMLLRAGTGQSIRGRGRLQRIMIATELALSVVLLVGAGLLSRSLAKLSVADPGFRSDHLLTVRLGMPSSMYRDDDALRVIYRDMMARLAALPGVVSVTGISNLPFDGGSSSTGVRLEGEDSATAATRPHEVQQRSVQPNYFGVLGIPLRAGRAFDDGDRQSSTSVVIISEALARRDWPNTSPLGARVYFQREWRTVVGIVGDVKTTSLSADTDPTLYAPIQQRSTSLVLALRTRGEPTTLVPAVRVVVRDVAPGAVVTRAESMEARIRQSFGEERFRTILIDLFGIIAAVLAAVGAYGVTTRAVSARMKEVGIRVALGATSASVVRMIVTATCTGAGLGVVTGVVLAFVASRALAPYLYGVSSSDPVTYGAILALLAFVSVLASWLPARRAGRIAPATVLRGE